MSKRESETAAMTGTGGRRSAAGEGNAAVKQCIVGIDGA